MFLSLVILAKRLKYTNSSFKCYFLGKTGIHSVTCSFLWRALVAANSWLIDYQISGELIIKSPNFYFKMFGEWITKSPENWLQNHRRIDYKIFGELITKSPENWLQNLRRIDYKISGELITKSPENWLQILLIFYFKISGELITKSPENWLQNLQIIDYKIFELFSNLCLIKYLREVFYDISELTACWMFK